MKNLRIRTPASRWTLLLLLMTLSASLAPAAPVSAQGMLGLLPEPITSDDLDAYADHLGLSEEQLLAISGIHAHYLADYRRFRERDVDDFLDHLRANMPQRFEPAGFSLAKNAIKETERLMGRVRRIDDSFFGQMQSVLTQDQVTRMSRIRMQRDRARLATESSQIVGYVNPAVLIDLSEMVEGLYLSPQDQARVEPILETYERRLTRAVTGLYELGIKKAIEVIETFEALELTEESMRDPRQVAALFQTAQDVWQEHVREFLEEAGKIAEMQRRTFRQLADVMPHKEARLLRRVYFRQAYAEAAHIGSRAEREYTAALSLETLDSDMRRTIEAMTQSHSRAQDRRADRIADLLDEIRFELTLEQAVQQGRDPRRQRISEIRDEADHADEQAIESLHAILGEDRAAELAKTDRAEDVQDQIEAIIAGRTGRIHPQASSNVRRRSAQTSNDGRNASFQPLSSRNLPNAMTDRDIRQYARLLALEEADALVLQSLYDDYADSFEAIEAAHLDPLDDKVRTLSRAARNGDDVDESTIEQLVQDYRDAFDAIHSLEESFFQDIAVVVPESEDNAPQVMLERLRMQRERDRYAAAAAQARSPGGRPVGPWSVQRRNEEDRVDLSRIIHNLSGLSLPENEISTLLEEYERELTSLVQEKFEKDVALSEAVTQMDIAMQRNRGASAGDGRRGQWRTLGRAVRSAGEEASNAGQRIATLNRTTLESLTRSLSQEQAEDLRRRYDREAFSFVYDDDSSAEPLLDAALGTPGLSNGQRSRLRDLAMHYRASYGDLTQQIVDVYRESATEPDSDRGRARLSRIEMNRVERLEFERLELNRRTERQIRAILSPEQLNHLAQQNAS